MRDRDFASGLSLLYLCYAVLADAVADDINILRFLQDNGFGPVEQLPKKASEIFAAFRQPDHTKSGR